jgi:hypothetical protein
MILILMFVLTTQLFSWDDNSQVSISFSDVFNKHKSAIGDAPNSSDYQSYQLFLNNADLYFKSNKEIQIKDFPVSQNENKTIIVKACRSIIDANTKFVIGNSKDNISGKAPSINSFNGIIEGEPGSKINLFYINGSIFCRIEEPNSNPFILCPTVNQSGTEHILISEKKFYSKGNFDFNCYSDILQQDFKDTHKNYKYKTLSDKMLEVEVAVETDSEFFTATGGTVEKAQAYTLALFSMVSAIYEEELNVIIYIPWLKTWTDNPRDPYDVKGNAYALPDKVGPYWQENYQDVKRDLFHVITSISYGGGGFGYFDALCGMNGNWGFSVSSVQAGHKYPTYAFTYDAYIIAHELGHNFNGQHTHSCFFGYPLDTCVAADAIAGGCLDSLQTDKPNPGSIMSYCGGTNNQFGLGYQVRMTFLPQNRQLMRQTAENASCLTEPTKPFVFIHKPQNTIIYKPGDTTRIIWTSARVNNIKLEFSDDSCVTWYPIASNISADERQFIWNLPDICSKSVFIRISDVWNPETSDTSMLPITIYKEDIDGLIAYYPFNSNSNDEQLCHFYDAQQVNNPELCKDFYNNENSAYNFNGSNYLFVPKFNYTFSDFTVSFWFNATDLSGVRQIIGSNWQEAWVFSIYYWGQYGVALYWDGNGAPFQMWGGWLETNKWYHGAFTFNGNSAKLYLNGIVVAESPNENHKINNFVEQPLYIGSRKDTDYFSGIIDNIMVYKRALSQEEIYKLYLGTVPVIEPDNELINTDDILVTTPNPFSSSIEIQYYLSQPGHVKLTLIDINGRVIADLIDKNVKGGWHSLVVNGSGLGNGVFFLNLETGGKQVVKKIHKID